MFFKVHDIVYVRKLGIVYICTPVVRKTWECWCEATENICYIAIITIIITPTINLYRVNVCLSIYL